MEDISLCYGTFNLIHPGHIRYLGYAKKQACKLVVAIAGVDTGNVSEGPFFSFKERAEALLAISIVDRVIILDGTDLLGVVKELNPKCLVLGNEFKNKRYSEVADAIQYLESKGSAVVYHAGEVSYATSEFLHMDLSKTEKERRRLFFEICSSNGFSSANLIESIKKFSTSQLLVVGDTIVDQYIACDAIGMSSEAPLIVAKEIDSEEYIGGAAIVASHISQLGAECHFISVVGDDKNAVYVQNQLDHYDVKHYLFHDSSRPTTFKIRYLIDGHKVFRVSKLKEHSISEAIEKKIIEKIEELAPSIKGILVSDFVYGVITEKILDAIIKISKSNGLLIFGDLQCSSQIGNITKFKDFDLICPTEREARIALNESGEGIEVLACNLVNLTNAKNLVLKMGSDGFISYHATGDSFSQRQYFPALTVKPLDVTGAGDSVLSAMAVGLSSGMTLIESSAVAACAASIAVNTLGNMPISSDSVVEYIKNIESSINYAFG